MPGKAMEIMSSAIIEHTENSQGIRTCERHILLDQPGPVMGGPIWWMREGRAVGAVCLDFSKVFDTLQSGMVKKENTFKCVCIYTHVWVLVDGKLNVSQ